MKEKTISKSSLKNYLTTYVQIVKDTFTPEQFRTLEEMARVCITALKSGRKLLLCGNGGSAADAQHIAAELIGRFKHERKSLPAIALTTDTSILTAMANDYSFDVVFSRQVEGLGESGDVLIALSTSGNSKNVLEAVSKAKSLGITTLGLTGKTGGKLKNNAD
jgi:D-sedoheptulose 7-phosphate isomerase